MLEVGTKATNPRTGTQFELLELEPTGFVMQYTMNDATSVPDFAEHFHVGWHEDFKVLGGTGVYTLDGKEGRVSAGETVPMPEQVKHLHPRNVGDEPMIMELHAKVSGHGPNAIKDTLGYFFTMFEWEAEGKIALDRHGLPKHPMKFAAAGRVLGGAGGYDAWIPKAAADFAGATVGRLALAMGFSVIDPRFQ